MAWLRGPCTIYTIMKELSSSASTYHKSRAGTAYSVAKRLLGFEMLVQGETLGEGGERLVSISEKGIAALKAWIVPPIPLPDIAHSADLIRLRFFFLGAVEQDQRVQFIDNVVEGLKVFLLKCETLVQANEDIGDYFGALATLSTVLETRARIEWLTIVRKWVIDPMPSNGHWTQMILEGKV